MKLAKVKSNNNVVYIIPLKHISHLCTTADGQNNIIMNNGSTICGVDYFTFYTLKQELGKLK